jgi:uncharacterized protein HemY
MTPKSGEAFATLTHARLRAAQGDVEGALRTLRVILAVQPAHRDAQGLVDELASRAVERQRKPPAAAVAQLTSWLARVERNRGPQHVR